MKLVIRRSLLGIAVVLSLAGWGKESKKASFAVDPAKLAAVKRVAVVTVYGPAVEREGFKTKIQLQPFSNAAEEVVTSALAKAGYEVVALQETKAAIARDYVNAFVDAYVSELARGNKVKESDQRVQQARQAFLAGGLQFNNSSVSTVSRNTSYVYGADSNFTSNLQFTVDGDPTEAPAKVTHNKSTIQTLAAIAKSLQADAFMIVRINPALAGVATPKLDNSGGIFSGIDNVRKSVKAVRTGKYGSNVLDLSLYSTSGQPIFEDHIITRSEKDSGNAITNMNVVRGVGHDAALPLLKEAVDISLRRSLKNLTGKEVPANASGLGVESIEAAVAAAATARPATAPASIAGSYVLATVLTNPVPHALATGVTYESGTLEMREDGTYTFEIVTGSTMTVNGKSRARAPKTSTVKGSYTVDGDKLKFTAQGGMLVRLFAPANGEWMGDVVTIYPGGLGFKRK